MHNKIQDGTRIRYINTGSALLPGGSLVVIGDMVAVTSTDLDIGEEGACEVWGVFELEKDAAAISQGAAVYLDASGKCTATVGDVVVGKAWASATAAQTVVHVGINM